MTRLSSVFLSLNILLEVLVGAVRQLQEKNGIQFVKEEANILLFAGNKIVYIRNSKNSTRGLQHLIYTFGNVAGYKINSKTSINLLYINDNQVKKEIMSTIHFTIATNTLKYLCT